MDLGRQMKKQYEKLKENETVTGNDLLTRIENENEQNDANEHIGFEKTESFENENASQESDENENSFSKMDGNENTSENKTENEPIDSTITEFSVTYKEEKIEGFMDIESGIELQFYQPLTLTPQWYEPLNPYNPDGEDFERWEDYHFLQMVMNESGLETIIFNHRGQRKTIVFDETDEDKVILKINGGE